MSIAGGVHKAVERAAVVGCDCVQVFTKNNNQWRAKEIVPEEAARFRDALEEGGVSHPIAHDSYLINLASPDETLWRRSIEAFTVELQRAELLGIRYVVTHPGAYTGSSEPEGLERIVRALDEILRKTRRLRANCLLETTAGQGTSLGWRFEHLAAILDAVKAPERLGVCFDTCHVFAAGYPLETEKEYRATMKAFDAAVGLKRIKAFHLNDSKRELGSRVDRHAHIGRGKMGLAPFRHLLGDRRFRKIPMYLETPKGEEDGVDLDVVNLQVLRGLVPGKAAG
jgi:deoxyribonuclease-4